MRKFSSATSEQNFLLLASKNDLKRDELFTWATSFPQERDCVQGGGQFLCDAVLTDGDQRLSRFYRVTMHRSQHKHNPLSLHTSKANTHKHTAVTAEKHQVWVSPRTDWMWELASSVLRDVRPWTRKPKVVYFQSLGVVRPEHLTYQQQGWSL